jgi:hypothetical protein
MAKAWPAKLRLDRSVGGLLAVAGPAEVGLEAGQAVLDGLGVSRLQIAEMAAEARLAVTADESDLTFTYFADRTAAREALRGDLAKASNQFFRGATSKSRDYRLAVQADGSYRMEFFSPANSPGYGKLYVQVVGGDGRVMMEYKDTLGPEGLIERKWIRGGP